MKVSELEGKQLNRLVAQAIGWQYDERSIIPGWTKDGEVKFVGFFDPSGNWSIGGPIIEREKIEIIYYGDLGDKGPWEAQMGCDTHYIDQGPGDAIAGSTPLVAAMRCFVAAKLGEDVTINAGPNPEIQNGDS